MTWIAEYRAPDGRWQQLTAGERVRDVIRHLRRWRDGQGHLVPETRVRLA